MKKYFLSLVAMAAMLFATSCQESLVEPQLAGPTTFTVQLPDQMGTKAIGEASSVNKLYVQVYPSDVTKNLVFQTTADVVDGLADVELNLIQDQSYDIIFWAQNGNAYTTADLRSIPMDKKYHNDDEGAAFYAYINDFTPNGVSNQVTLTRPFAQLNLGTTAESLETNAGEVTLSRSYIKVGKVATSFNTVLGQGEGEQTVLFELKAVPTETLTVKVNGVDVSYKYISMDYLAVSSDKKAVVDIEALIETTKGNISHEFTSVPVQKNYRTNIIGNLISSKTDFNIIVNDEWDGENVVNVASDAKAAQAMLDAATDGTTIQLLPGINYGTLYLRPVSGQQNTITDCDYLNYRNEMLREVENLTIIGAPGATVDAIKVVAGHIEGSTGYVVDIQNLVVDGVEFNDTYINPPHSYSAPLFFDLTYTNVNGLTVRNCKLIGNNANMNFVYFYGSGKPANSRFETAAKNITITDNTVDGIARLCELRQAENVTIKGNTIRNTALHGMLLAVDGGTYSGKVTITDNIAEGIHERFVRMAGAGAAEVVIKDNIINNYLGTDADYIKVTDGSNVTIENNTLTSVGADDAESVQALLDNAKNGVTIQLQPGVNYGTLYMRPVAGGAQTKVVDWIGNNYRFETYSLFENITIVGAEGATVDAIKIEGGTYYNTEHSQAATYPVMLSLVELKNVVFDGVTFTGKGGYDPQGHGNAVNLSGSNIKVDGLTFKNCVLNNSENNARLLYKTESTTHVHNYSYDGQNYTFSPSLKDVTITGCTFNGGYMGLELRETNNVTITNNVFNVADRNILLPVNTGCTYSGNITIKENVSNNAHERFVRADGTGDAIVLIKDNIINNYMGTDADYIKVTNGNNVTIENNVLGVSTPAQLKEAIIEGGKIELMNDITVDEWIMFSEDYNIGDGTIITIDEINVTIDGKGHTLTVNAIESAGNNDQLFQGASNLNISDLTIKYADGLTTGGLGMVSGVIKNVHFVGGDASASSAAIFPGNGEIKVEGCTFDTNGVAIYFEEERDNLTVTGCTFNQKNNKNVILLYGDVKFTNNTINSGRTVNIVSGSPVVDRNNFNDVRLKVYEAATATVSKNIINTLEFQTTTHNSTFTDNTLSAAAQAALDACN